MGSLWYNSNNMRTGIILILMGVILLGFGFWVKSQQSVEQKDDTYTQQQDAYERKQRKQVGVWWVDVPANAKM